jgi:hypothetical protein
MPPSFLTPAKVFALLHDGRFVAGFLFQLSTLDGMCSIFPAADPSRGRPFDAAFLDLKCLLFVKEFRELEPDQEETFVGQVPGRRIEVHFTDGDRLVGTTNSYDAEDQGFFVVPANSLGNLQHVFVLNSSVLQIRRWERRTRTKTQGVTPAAIFRNPVTNRRRSPRVPLKVSTNAKWRDEAGLLQTETGMTQIVSAHGALLLMDRKVTPGVDLEVTNLLSAATATAQVVYVGSRTKEPGLDVGIELHRPDPNFWIGSAPERPAGAPCTA